MNSVKFDNPTVFLMLGYPGAGKTFFARQFAEKSGMVHLSADRIRFELFDKPLYNREENDIVFRLMDYMLEEFLNTGASVIYDASMNSKNQRRQKRNDIRKFTKNILTIWVQTDMDTAKQRATNRDRRSTDDKYTSSIDDSLFDKLRKELSRPENEDYVVISGKHVFTNQNHVVRKKVEALGWLKDRPQLKSITNTRSVSGIGSRLIRD